jgi:hypothetical protein
MLQMQSTTPYDSRARRFFEMYFRLPGDILRVTPMSSAPSKALAGFPAVGLLAVTRAALGCGIGMMVAAKFQRSSTRTTTAIALLSVGVLGTLPWVVESVMQVVNRPGSERSMNRRLASIRANSGFDSGTEMF